MVELLMSFFKYWALLFKICICFQLDDGSSSLSGRPPVVTDAGIHSDFPRWERRGGEKRVGEKVTVEEEGEQEEGGVVVD